MKTPFTSEQFFSIFEQYNSAVFPAQLILFILGLLALGLIHYQKPVKNGLITGFLALLWLWIGIVYHISFFTSINKAAYAFGGLFILQGLFLIVELFRNKLEFSFTGKREAYVGYFFILFGLIIYPLIGYLLEGSSVRTISVGLPCPTTILTFGFFMLTSRQFPKYLLIIPTLWAIIGTAAAVNFGVYQDYLMPLAALIADFYLMPRKKNI